jgi:Mg-chelatase subunit ChlD
MLPELTSLASLASSRGDVTLRVGEPDCNWSFNWATCTITVNPTDLALRPPDYCRGLILHESAHAALTRVAEIIPRDLYQAEIHPLLNVIEDCRIENWLQQRFPGCRPWIRLYNNRLLGRPSETNCERLAGDPAGGFLAGLLDHWWNETPQLTFHPETQSALAEVLPHFEEAIAAFPAPQVPNAAPTRKLYASHPVSLCFRSQDYESEPPPEECIIRMLQHRMWGITWQHIVPVFLRLLQHPDSEPTRRYVARLAVELFQTNSLITGSGKAVKVVASYAVRNPSSRPSAGTARGSFQDGDRDEYSKAVATHATLIESCAAALLRVLTADSRPQRTRFHRSGHALDLRVAMQFEADPRLCDKLWQRTTLPRHPDPAFVVLMDGSGSMRGERAAATFAGLIVLREVCLRLGISLSIIAFSNEARLIQSCAEPHARGIQSKLAGLLEPSGGTDISQALELASTLLDSSPHRHRHLWILSDGETRNPETARKKLRAIGRDGVMLHGLGLGPDSIGIATLVPGAPANLSPAQLPAIFAARLHSHVKSGS